MREVIQAQAVEAKRRSDFVEAALAARMQAEESGKGYLASDVRDYLRARAQGKAAVRPRAKFWCG